MLSPEERDRIISALQDWAKHAPDEPVWGFIESDSLKTPREILDDVRENTSDGQAILEIIEYGVRRIGLEETVRKLRMRRINQG